LPISEEEQAFSLRQHARHLWEVSDYEGALAAEQDAAKLYYKLKELDRERFVNDYAKSLGNVATLLSTLGRRREAAYWAAAALD